MGDLSPTPDRDLAGSRVFVSGGAGFVGTALCHRLAALDCEEIVVVDNLLSAEDRPWLHDAPITFVKGSAADRALLGDLGLDFDFAFHLATFHGNQNSIERPFEDQANNGMPSLALFDHLSRSQRLQTIVYASAGCTVARKGEGTPAATTEDADVSLFLDSPYQISKIVGELYGNYYMSNHRLPFVKARFQNVYGPGEILGAGDWRGTAATVWRNVVPTFVFKALRGDSIELHGGGRATRDFVYVDDIAHGLVRCALAASPGDVFNLASGIETSIRELAEVVCRLSNSSSELLGVDQRGWDHSIRRYGSTDHASEALGFTAATSLEDGIDATIHWFRNHWDLIDQCMSRHASKVASPDS